MNSCVGGNKSLFVNKNARCKFSIIVYTLTRYFIHIGDDR